MRLSTICASIVVLASLNMTGRAVWVHYAEFNPATAEFDRAASQHDIDGMHAAMDRQDDALDRETDFFWFLGPSKS